MLWQVYAVRKVWKYKSELLSRNQRRPKRENSKQDLSYEIYLHVLSRSARQGMSRL